MSTQGAREYAYVNERNFEDDVEAGLVEMGYMISDESGYDRPSAIKTDSLIAFIKDTQHQEWNKVESLHGAQAEQRFIAALERVLDHEGLIYTLRHGFKMAPGASFKLCHFKPKSELNAGLAKNCKMNRFEVVRQLHYGTRKDDENNSLDVVLFLNGFPIVTMELKNHLTGQRVQNAIMQYKQDRNPRETIFMPDRSSLVHFALDGDEAYMTTWLKGKATYFLPFNKGNGRQGAGNPPNQNGGYRTDYLWKDILAPDSVLEIIERFMRRQLDDDGKLEAIIFPRYHQLDVVRKLVGAVKVDLPGHNYLIQHSAGSGKSNSIAWLSHHLASLNDNDGNAIFDSVVVLTDRIVLDNQLQTTIYDIDHKQGVVQKIEKGSKELLEAINSGKRIIISTIQKFPYIYKETDVAGRNFAIIIDEAHSSQSGEAHKKTKQALGDHSSEEELEKALVEAAAEDAQEDEFSKPDGDLELYQELSAQGIQKNLSFFAFTATPKPATLEVFGTRDEDGVPHPFHLYSMKQAIDEGFILDVLKNYTTFNTYFELIKSTPDDPRYATTRAKRSIMNMVKLHPANIEKKSEIIVEHFRSKVAHKIDGKAKAMVVTSSRLAAVRYTMAFKKYISNMGYTDLGVLVAYSGSIDDGSGARTEADINGFPSTEITNKFDTDAYQVMIVANKFQTGFDQPLLSAMYVDKILTGIAAVQTLSRLNRTHKNKTNVFVLDFMNDWTVIKAAFENYYTVTELDRTTDINVVYEIERRLDGFGVYTQQEVKNLADIWFNKTDTEGVLKQVLRFLDPAKDRFSALNDERQFEFRELTKKFIRSYSFITQMVQLQDEELHRLNAYLTFLYKELPLVGGRRVDISGEVDLSSIKIEDIGTESIELEGGKELKNPGGSAGVQVEEDREPLSMIIEEMNERFGTEFEQSDKILLAAMVSLEQDEDLILKAKNNSIEDFARPFAEAFEKVLMKLMVENEAFFDAIGEDREKIDFLERRMLKPFFDKVQ